MNVHYTFFFFEKNEHFTSFLIAVQLHFCKRVVITLRKNNDYFYNNYLL